MNGTIFAMGIRRKCLWRNTLRQIRGRKFVVSPYVVRLYIESSYTSVRLFTPRILGGNFPAIPYGLGTPSRGGRYASFG